MPDEPNTDQLAADGDVIPDGVDEPTDEELAEAEQFFKDLDDKRC